MKTRKLTPARKSRKIKISHRNVVKISTNSLKMEVEWKNNGDYFQKFSLYDINLMPIQRTESLGSTTLIKNF